LVTKPKARPKSVHQRLSSMSRRILDLKIFFLKFKIENAIFCYGSVYDFRERSKEDQDI